MKIYKFYIKPFLRHPLNKKNKIKAILNFFKWQVLLRHAHFNKSYIITPYIGNLKIIVKKNLNGITGNLYSGLHEFEQMGFLLHFLRKDDLFFDIGANVGIYTLLASGIKGASSFSFEPVPQTFNFLKNNVALNNLENTVTLYNAGVGNKEAELIFSTDNDCTNSVVSEDYAGKKEKIKVINLDKLFNEKIDKCTLIKIDTEGFEYQVLLGAKSILENKNVKAILVEMNNPEKINSILLENGFTAYFYDVFKREFSLVDYSGKADIVYVRDLPFVIDRIKSCEPIEINKVII